jgi:metallo-beta-lactamase family protein
MINSTDESRALASRHGPMVILSASGMATGGRVLHHLAHYARQPSQHGHSDGLPGPRHARRLPWPSGASTVRIHGRDVAVNAEVVQLQSASAHADANQLLAWLRTMPRAAPDQVYVVHGEARRPTTLRRRIVRELGWRAVVPEHGSTWPT